MLYFIQTTRFSPIDFKKYGFKVIDDNTLLLEKDFSIWKKRKLYDLGWGKENGYCRTPIPSKEELFLMAFPKDYTNDYEEQFNYWGSITILLEEHCDFLLEEIKRKIIENNEFLKKYEHIFVYIDLELNIPSNLIDKVQDFKYISNCKKWKQMKEEFGITK